MTHNNIFITKRKQYESSMAYQGAKLNCVISLLLLGVCQTIKSCEIKRRSGEEFARIKW